MSTAVSSVTGIAGITCGAVIVGLAAVGFTRATATGVAVARGATVNQIVVAVGAGGMGVAVSTGWLVDVAVAGRGVADGKGVTDGRGVADGCCTKATTWGGVVAVAIGNKTVIVNGSSSSPPECSTRSENICV